MLLILIDALLLFSYIPFAPFHFSVTMLVTLRTWSACLIFDIQRNYIYAFGLVLTRIILINEAGASYNRPIYFLTHPVSSYWVYFSVNTPFFCCLHHTLVFGKFSYSCC